MYKQCFLIFVGFYSFFTLASECTNCTVKHVGCSYTYENKQTCNVVLDQNIANKPACATGGGNNRYAIDITKDAGKAIMSLASAALVSGKSVIIYGTGKCDILSNYESANLLYLNR